MWKLYPSIPAEDLEVCLEKTSMYFNLDIYKAKTSLFEQFLEETIKTFDGCFGRYKPKRMITNKLVWVKIPSQKTNYQMRLVNNIPFDFAKAEFDIHKIAYKNHIAPKPIELVACQKGKSSSFGVVMELMDGDLRDLLLMKLPTAKLKGVFSQIRKIVEKVYNKLDLEILYLDIESIGFRLTEGGNYTILICDWEMAKPISLSDDMERKYIFTIFSLEQSFLEFVNMVVHRSEHERIKAAFNKVFHTHHL